MSFYSWQNKTLLLRVYAQPRASKDEIVGSYGDCLKIRITAAPVDGKANAHLIKFLAKIFNVPGKNIKLMKGQQGRTKQLAIKSPQQLPKIIQVCD